MRRAAQRLVLAQLQSQGAALHHPEALSLQLQQGGTAWPSQQHQQHQLQHQQRRNAQGFARIAEHEKGQTKFSGYYAGGFYINNVQVPGSVIAQADMFALWRPRKMDEVTVESLVFLDLITPAPQVLVFGCGATAQQLPPAVASYLQRKGIQVEVLDSRNATGYFNVLNEEGRVVVGALLAPDPDVPLSQLLPDVKPPLEQDIWASSGGGR